MSWRRADFQRVSSLWQGWPLDVPVAVPRKRFNPPKHSAVSTAPAAFVVWGIHYDQVEGQSFDADEEPVRKGTVRVRFWVQPGAGDSFYDELYSAAEALFADDEGLVFWETVPIEGKPSIVGVDAGASEWWVEGFDKRFTGGVSA